ncbi:biliverdin-producing heme oxygenase [Paludisphaera rhizosphaerae]|uniref:biliverdin-producing heme oxygenase n=1 Tax=Paludisphaera rhizosphaerae TaxID=2711216 RepID=UPI0013ED01E9|nr:biliverdin-producing heme oxygenase [Paludisphaera rhizosphaerae]
MMMSRLKEATRLHHEAVETRLGSYRLTRSLDGYKRVLRRFLGFHRPVEDALVKIPGWPAVGINPDERRKAHLLEADLRTLGVSESELAAQPNCPFPPPLTSLPEALGVMYVLEGSTLGGQYMRKLVRETLGLTPESGCAYFASYGESVGPMWKAFGAAVDAFATTDEIRATIERSAVATFEAVDGWFAEGLASDRSAS